MATIAPASLFGGVVSVFLLVSAAVGEIGIFSHSYTGTHSKLILYPFSMRDITCDFIRGIRDNLKKVLVVINSGCSDPRQQIIFTLHLYYYK